MPETAPSYFKTRNTQHFNIYNITNNGIFMEKDVIDERVEFWNDIFNDYKHLWNVTFDFHSVWISDTAILHLIT